MIMFPGLLLSPVFSFKMVIFPNQQSIIKAMDVDQLKKQLLSATNNDPLVEQAISFASHAHKQQKRANQRPYITHLLEVGLILAEENFSNETVAAGVLHDVIEDTETEIDQLQEKFGVQVSGMVAGVTKVKTVTSKNAKTETYRRLLVAASEDARVLIIKLADRLHNMRTLEFLNKEKQLRISQETINVYVPLAHRLGMSNIAHELEDRSLWITKPEAYHEAKLIRSEAQRFGEQQLNQAKDDLETELNNQRINTQTVKYRVKNVFSIAEKMARGGERQEIDDILGLRAIVGSKSECYQALGVVHQMWPPIAGKFDDYIARPRSNLYQSLHTTVNINGRITEVQIRTPEMDQIAERGLAAHWLYKEQIREGGPVEIQGFIQQVAENQKDPLLKVEDAFQALRDDFFKDEIYLFTPQGETKILPKDSCSIDFAYSIHSQLGDKISGARVNGRLSRITQPLSSGDVVEIITSNSSTPSLDWLKIVKTTKARQSIQKHHRTDYKQQANIKALNTLLDRVNSLTNKPLTLDQLLTVLKERKIALGELRQKDLNSLAKSISTLSPELRKESAETKVKARPDPQNKMNQSILIDGLDNIAVHFAGCCQPQQDQPIVAYLSKKGVTIHAEQCRQLNHRPLDKIMPAEWNTEYLSFLKTYSTQFLDRVGLLEKISNAVKRSGSEIKSIQLDSNQGVVRGKLTVLLTSKQQDTALLINLKQIDGALQISSVNERD
jgi:GTP pyrophosphokinase